MRQESDNPTSDSYGWMICHQAVVEKVRAMAFDGNIKLAETLAKCIADYPDLTSLSVKIGKPDGQVGKRCSHNKKMS